MFPKEVEQEESRRMELLSVQPWITDHQWSLGQAFLALLRNLPSLAVLLCLIDSTRKNNFLTIAKSPEALITLLYFWNSILVILKKVSFFLAYIGPKHNVTITHLSKPALLTANKWRDTECLACL